MKKYFFLKLVPPRPSFFYDMTEPERNIMVEHQVYWKDLTLKGYTVVYGPVMDPDGPYGMGVLRVDSEEELNDLMAHDPANGLNTYKVYAMRAVLPDK